MIEGQVYQGGYQYRLQATVGENFRGVETYLFDVDEDLYGKEIVTQLCRFQRPERKFPSLEALKSRLLADAKDGRRYFEKTEK